MRYITKPVIIEAIQWDGTQKGIDKIQEEFPNIEISPAYIITGISESSPILIGNVRFNMKIRTLEGDMCFHEGYYIIRGLKGEYYPCREDIFKEKYQEFNAEDIEK